MNKVKEEKGQRGGQTATEESDQWSGYRQRG